MKTLRLPLLLAAVAATAPLLLANSAELGQPAPQVLQSQARSPAYHGKTPAGIKSMTVRVTGSPGTHFELYLGRSLGSKAIVLASSRIPKGGVLRISLQFPNRLPQLKLYSQSSAPVSAKLAQVSL